MGWESTELNTALLGKNPKQQLVPYQQPKSSHQRARMASGRQGSDWESPQTQLYDLKWTSGSFHLLQKNLWLHELYVRKQNKHSSGQITLAVGRG